MIDSANLQTRASCSRGISTSSAVLAFLSLAFGVLHYVHLRPPGGTKFLVLRIFAAALSPI